MQPFSTPSCPGRTHCPAIAECRLVPKATAPPQQPHPNPNGGPVDRWPPFDVYPGLEGRQVEVRFHPLDLRRLRVYCEGRRCEDAVAVELLQQTSPRVDSSHLTQQGSAEPASPSHYLFQLLERHRQHKRRVLSPLQLAATEGGEDQV